MNTIKINDVSFTYTPKAKEKKWAISHITTTIDENDFVAIVGHTGSGKSTFIQTLNALLIPTSGQVNVDSFCIAKKIKLKNIQQLRKKVGIVFQFPEYQLFKETVEKDLLFGPKNFIKDLKNEKEFALNALNLVGLDASYLEKSPFELSGGEKRRVAIAGILAFQPDILIVDEPTAGLDPLSAKKMMELFQNLHEKEQKTIILVTHQMNDVLTYANKVMILKNGKLEIEGNTMDIFLNNDLEKYALDLPDILKLVHLLKEKYPALKEKNIKDIPSFIQAYKEVIA